MAAQANIYAYNRTHAFEEYGGILQGSTQALFLVVADNSYTPQAHDALEKAAEARGYTCGITQLMLCGRMGASAPDQQQESTETPASDQLHDSTVTLEPGQLCNLIEALDPESVIVWGKDAVELCAHAYRLENTNEGRAIAWGRPLCLLPEPEALMTTDKGKQRLWALIKLCTCNRIRPGAGT